MASEFLNKVFSFNLSVISPTLWWHTLDLMLSYEDNEHALLASLMSCFASSGNIASDNTITTQVQIAYGQFEPRLSANDLLHNFHNVFLSTL